MSESNGIENQRKLSPGLKSALELGPILIFVALTYLRGIELAIGVFIVLAPLAMAITWWVERKISPMQWLGTGLILAFGLPSLIFDQPWIFKIKPTIASGLFAAVLLGGWAMKKPIIKSLFGTALEMPHDAWMTLTLRWGLFFLALAVANEIAWRTLSDEHWALAKFGYFAASFAFAISQAPLMMKYMKSDEPS